ncbi:FUSC family protein [Deinococcus rubellus]|uniref:FUSC family protein n=1 Tax=Deinococcus rubellus TaxID=1889240 RepID=A0ABY5YH94_9DEIO|nr:FUSC family protein [Deinococcus rubellus]UWX63173.1 FUSC family protein [Deinococcus rubellus]
MRRRTLLFRTAFAFAPEKWRPGTATRCALGVAIPIGLASLTGHAAWGILASIGALNAGLASFSGVYRSRLRLMLSASAVMGAVTLLALLLGPYLWLLVLAVTLLSFGLAVYGASNAAATTIGIQGTMIFIVLSGLNLPPALALPGGLLVLSGGLLQTVLLGVIWPLSPRHPERQAVARVYRQLSALIARLPQPGDQLADPAAFQDAWTVLDQARQLAWRSEHAELRRSLRVAEGLRAALVGYARADWTARQRGPAASRAAQQMSQALLTALRALENGLVHGQPHLTLEARAALNATLQRLVPTGEPDLNEWASLVVRLLTDLAAEDSDEPAIAGPTAPGRPPAQPESALAQWWRSASPRGSLGRHALKYALTLGLVTLLTRLFSVPHGYWLALTVGVVLRQDYLSTLTRGLARFGGTLAGVLLASLLIWALHPGPVALGLLSLGAAWLVYALFPTSYAAFSAAITLYVVFSVSASGLPERLVVEQRISLTLLGGLVALAVYLLWPEWPSAQLRGALQRAAEAQQRYVQAVAVFRRGGDPEQASTERRAARALRLQAEQLAQAARLEPPWGHARSDLTPAEADTALMQLHANAALSLSLHARSLLPANTEVADRSADQRSQMEQELAEAAQAAERLGRQLGGAP